MDQKSKTVPIPLRTKSKAAQERELLTLIQLEEEIIANKQREILIWEEKLKRLK